jgi:hypothetical protein
VWSTALGGSCDSNQAAAAASAHWRARRTRKARRPPWSAQMTSSRERRRSSDPSSLVHGAAALPPSPPGARASLLPFTPRAAMDLGWPPGELPCSAVGSASVRVPLPDELLQGAATIEPMHRIRRSAVEIVAFLPNAFLIVSSCFGSSVDVVSW